VGVLLVVGAPIGILLLLLAVPVELEVRLQGIEPLEGQVAIGWLFGLVRFRIPIPGAARTEKEPETRPKELPERARPRSRSRNALAALRPAEFRGRLYRLIRDVVRAVNVRRLSLRVRLGLGDPADTGRLWALMGPLDALARMGNAEVRLEPDFVDPVLEFQLDGRVRLVPLRFIALAVAFVLSPPTIRAWRTLRSNHA
jgi:hypothetical protein